MLPKIQLPEDWRLSEDPLIDLSQHPEILRKMSVKEFRNFRDLDGYKIDFMSTKVVHHSMVQKAHGNSERSSISIYLFHLLIVNNSFSAVPQGGCQTNELLRQVS